MDKTAVTLDPPLWARWMKQGQPRWTPATTRPGKKQRRYIFGGYSWLEDTIAWGTTLTKNSATFIRFLEELLVNLYSKMQVVLVMNNAACQKSASALAALSLLEHQLF